MVHRKRLWGIESDWSEKVRVYQQINQAPVTLNVLFGVRRQSVVSRPVARPDPLERGKVLCHSEFRGHGFRFPCPLCNEILGLWSITLLLLAHTMTVTKDPHDLNSLNLEYRQFLLF